MSKAISQHQPNVQTGYNKRAGFKLSTVRLKLPFYLGWSSKGTNGVQDSAGARRNVMTERASQGYLNIYGVRDNCISGSAQDTATSTEKIAFYFTIRAHKSTHKNSFLPNAQLRQELHDVDCQIVAARARYHSRGFLDDTNTATTLRSIQVRMTPRQARLGTSRRKNYCSTWQDKARTEERSPKMVRAAMPRLRALSTCCPLQTPAQA